MFESNSLPKLVVLGTGGTIAGRSALPNDNIGYVAAQINVAALADGIPGLAAHLDGFELVCEQVAQIDSKDMSFEVWVQLARRVEQLQTSPEVKAVVITHGTDTLEETAYFLSRVLSLHKPVVLTCAMRPASALSPDGPQNLLDALTVSKQAQAGVFVVCAGRVHSANCVQKVHPYRLDAFSSGDAGPIGFVEEDQVRWTTHVWDPIPTILNALQLPEAAAWPCVDIILNHAGADGRVVNALVQAGVQGLVVAGTGNGTVSSALQAALLKAQSAGVRVVLASRCTQGRVIACANEPWTLAINSNPVKARVDLLLSLMNSP